MKGLRVRQTLRLGKFFRVNLSKTGTSVSIGRPGATVNIGKTGARSTLGIPGSGISYTQPLVRPRVEPEIDGRFRPSQRIEPTFDADSEPTPLFEAEPQRARGIWPQIIRPILKLAAWAMLLGVLTTIVSALLTK